MGVFKDLAVNSGWDDLDLFAKSKYNGATLDYDIATEKVTFGQVKTQLTTDGFSSSGDDVSDFNNDVGYLTALAFGNLSDVTISGVATGDITYKSAGDWINLAGGSVGQVLTMAGGIPSWSAPAGGGNTIYSSDDSLAGTRVVSMGTNNLTFGSTGDATLLRFDSTNDRIGVGIAPTEKFQVNGSIKTAGGDIIQSGGTLNILENNVKVGAGTFGALTAGRGVHATGGAGFFRIGDLVGTDAGFFVNAGTINFGTISTDDLLIYVGNSIKGRLKTGTGQFRWGGTTTTSLTSEVIEVQGVQAFQNNVSNPAVTANTAKIFGIDSSDATTTLGLRLEQAVEAIGTFTPSNKLKVIINATEYWIQLDAV